MSTTELVTGDDGILECEKCGTKLSIEASNMAIMSDGNAETDRWVIDEDNGEYKCKDCSKTHCEYCGDKLEYESELKSNECIDCGDFCNTCKNLQMFDESTDEYYCPICN